MGVTLQETIKLDIIAALARGTMTISQLATTINRNYYTTRGSLSQLIHEGEVSPVGYQQRNGLYQLGSSDVMRNTMSTITTRGQKHKIIEILGMRQTQPHAALAVVNLPKHVARILKAAIGGYTSEHQANTTLNRIFEGMRSDRQALQVAIEIYDQILENPKNWSLKTLERFKLDPDYDEERIKEALNYFFPSTEAAPTPE